MLLFRDHFVHMQEALRSYLSIFQRDIVWTPQVLSMISLSEVNSNFKA